MLRRIVPALLALALFGALVSCGANEPAQLITPGAGIGPVTIGMRYQEVSALYGQMTNAIVDGRIAVGGYPDQGLDLILTSPEDFSLTADAVVIAVGAKTAAFGGFPRPGLTRAEIEAALGTAPLKAGPIDYYPAGVSVKYGTEGGADVAKAVGVFPPFTRAPSPPEMRPAKSGGGAG
jgi:hypothetical protein